MAIDVSPAQFASLRSTLLATPTPVPLSARFRALFTLRSLASPQAVSIIGEALEPGVSSALLGHELCYVLGQMRREEALGILERVLRDRQEHPMVRHEAAEAMGSISLPSSLPILHEFLSDPNPSVRETCELAIAKIQHDHSSSPSASGERGEDVFGTTDPAPALPLAPRSMHDTPSPSRPATRGDVARLREIFLDEKLDLFQRYRAMFALRNAAGPDASSEHGREVGVKAVEVLAEGFSDRSALFRHEIAYILGQLSHPASARSLLSVLRNKQENEMVRHEAAEALGSLATPEILPALQEFADPEKEESRVVRESCEVALDMYEYENSGELHYAVSLDKVDVAEPAQPEVQARMVAVA